MKGITLNFRSFLFVFIAVFLIHCKADENIPSKFIKNYTVSQTEALPVTNYLNWEYQDGAIPTNSLKPLKVVDRIEANGKVVYFSHLFSMISTPEGYLFSDDSGGKLVHSDKNFSLIKNIGTAGPGPGEFIQPRFSFVDNEENNIWTSGTSNKGFAIHNWDGELLTNFKPQTETFNPIISKFLIKDTKLYYSTPRSEGPITVLSKNGQPTLTFGQSLSKYAKKDQVIKKRGHLVPYNENSFLFVGENGPVFQRYSYAGELIEEHNWMDHPYFKSFFNGTKLRRQAEGNSNTVYLLFQDVTVMKDQSSVLALAYDYDTEGQVSCNSIIKFVSAGNKFFIEKVSLLKSPTPGENTWYESIEIDEENNRFLAFDYLSSAVHIFDLSKIL